MSSDWELVSMDNDRPSLAHVTGEDMKDVMTIKPEYFSGFNRVFIPYLHHLRGYYELATWPASSWLDSSVGRALHPYRRGHGFESRLSLIIFFACFNFTTT